METIRVQTDSVERIEALALDGSLDPVTGLTDLLVSIRRVSDGYFYDFNDDTFKNSGWTTRQEAMTEVSATNAPGEYYYDFDMSVITNQTANDTYMIRVDQSPGTDVANVPQTGEIKEGQYVDDIDESIASRAVPGDAMDLVASAVDDIWDEDVVAAHGTSDTAGLLLKALGGAVSQRSNNANLNALLGIADVSGRDLPEQVDIELTATHGSGAWTGGGLTQQDVRDAMKLAPTAGAPAAGSVDEHLDDILTDTSTIEPLVSTNLDATISSIASAIAALNDISIADVQTALTNQGYTTIRAALLDNLDTAISSLNNLSISDIQTAMTNQGYTTARAALLDNLNDAISDVISAIAALNDLSQTDVQAAMTSQGYTTARAVLLDYLDGAITGIPSAVDTVLTAAHGSGSWVSGGTSDWTTDEKRQIRDALGVDGDKTASAGGVVQDIDTLLDSVDTKVDDIENQVLRLLGLNHENIFIDETTYDVNTQLVSARVRIFDSKTNCDAATDGGSETTGLIATYQLTSVWEGINQFQTFKQTRE